MSMSRHANAPYTNSTLPITKPVRNPIVCSVVYQCRLLQVESPLASTCLHPPVIMSALGPCLCVPAQTFERCHVGRQAVLPSPCRIKSRLP